jgi:ATP-binding cassette subfamily F protein 3
MPLLAATNIRHSFGVDIILDGVSFTIDPGDRVGIVGRNGAGKTTLLRIMAGKLEPDYGGVVLQKGARLGYLTQDPVLDPDETLRGAAEAAFAELHRLHQQLDEVYHDMAVAKGADLDRLMRKQETLDRQIEAAGGYAIDHRIDQVLHGLGFVDSQFKVKVSGLSGGQKGRVALARMLLEEPDVLLLDEPTNHLDIDGRIWLENFLVDQFKGAVVMISHDRYLLDNVVTCIVETEQGRLIDYPGNYEAFREIRAERRLTMHRAYEKEQNRFRKEEEYIRRFKAGQRAKQAQGRLSKLTRAKTGALERPVEFASLSLNLKPAERSGDMVFQTRGLSKSYANHDGTEKVLFRDLDLDIQRGERWAIIGPNGAGKTTLVSCLLGLTKHDSGTSRIGSNLRVGYYRQTHEHVDPELTIWRYLQKVIQKENPGAALTEQAARNLAGAFLFSGDDQERDLGSLSGGERSRAVLAGLLASAKNLLVLDEPTNHLDIPSAERLEMALALDDPESDKKVGYDGTLILISHDRAFIDATCDHLLILDGQGNAKVFNGSYSEWREKEAELAKEQSQRDAEDRRAREAEEKRKRAAEEQARQQAKRASQESNNPLAKLKTQQIEERIEKLERRIKEIDASLGNPDVWQNAAKCNALGEERAKLMSDLEPLEFEWSRRAEEAL